MIRYISLLLFIGLLIGIVKMNPKIVQVLRVEQPSLITVVNVLGALQGWMKPTAGQ